MTGYTKGTWTYGVRKNGSIWLSLGDPVTGPHRQGDLHASEADARLIAAAPDLLEALKALSASIFFPNDDRSPDMSTALEMTVSAIAKAEGRS